MSDYKKQWGKQASDLLVGKMVVSVKYLTNADMKAFGWYRSAVVITFSDGTTLIPSADDEGNDAGALFTNNRLLPVIPVI
jgi:hypothetical protein